MKWFKLRSGLIPIEFPLGIIDRPSDLDIYYFKEVDNKIEEISDKTICMQRDDTSIEKWVEKYGFTLFAWGTPLLVTAGSMGVFSVPSIIFAVILMGHLLYLIISQYMESLNKSPYECVFNRIDGTISYFCIQERRTKTIPFSDSKFYWEIYGYKSSVRAKGIYSIFDKDGYMIMKFKSEDTGAINVGLKLHSFLVWYMDRNRPLPPGIRFNQYRQSDYDRRESEGFPKSLFCSFIPTIDIDNINRNIESDRSSEEYIKLQNFVNSI